MPTYYIDPIGGNDGASGLTFATRWRTLAAGPTSGRIAPGDELRFIESPAPTLIGNCTWTNNTRTIGVPAGTVRLIDALTANTGWVMTPTVALNAPSSTRLIGGAAVNFTPSTAFTTGKLAYKPVTMDLTGFRQVNCWVRSTGLTANTLFIDLCSDATGDVPIVSIPVRDSAPAGVWIAAMAAHTGAIGTINSIAVRATVDPGTPTILINCLWASKAPGAADEITLATLVSRGAYTLSPPGRGAGTGDEPLLQVVGVTSDTTVVLNYARGLGAITSLEASGRAYDGVTGTVPTYAHQCHPFVEPRNWTPNVAGGSTPAGQILWSGGWSATDMASRTGMTRVMLTNTGRLFSSLVGHTFENFALSTITTGSSIPGADRCSAVNCYLHGIGTAGNTMRGMSISACCYAHTDVGFANTTTSHLLMSDLYVYGGSVAWNTSGGPMWVRGATIRNSPGAGLIFGQNPVTEGVVAADIVTLGNTAGISAVLGVNARLLNATLTEATEVSHLSSFESFVSIENLDGVAGNDVLFHPFGRLIRQTAVVDTQPTAWEARVTSTSAAQLSPMRTRLGLFEITLGRVNTIAVRMRRNNTGLSLGLSYLAVEGLPGIAQEQRAVMTAAANTWETVLLSLTPTGTGTRIVGIDLIAWGGTTFVGYVEAVTVS